MTVFLGSSQPGCTLAELRAKLQARLSRLTDLEADGFINDAHRELHEAYDWPWLLVEVEGTGPIQLSDFGRVEYVLNATQNGSKLDYADKGWLAQSGYTDFEAEGTPSMWFRDGQDTVATYPASTSDTLTVAYWREPSKLEADGDQTVNPSRYCPLVLDLAYARAMGEQRDNAEIAESILSRVERRIARVAAKVMVASSEPDMIVPSGDW